MRRYLLAAAAAVVLIVANESAAKLMIAFRPAPQRAVTADVVVVGKITAIEKDTVDAPVAPGVEEKVTHKIAVVKIQTNLGGANNLTHIKVGFVPQGNAPGRGGPPVKPGQPQIQPVRPIRPGMQAPELKEGQEMLFFLVKHHSGDFYTMPGMSPPVDVSNDEGKKELEKVKHVTELLADPMKGLKSDKADVRGETATLLVMKYRTFESGGETEEVAINADESKLILKAIAEADWKAVRGREAGVNAQSAFYQLGLTENDGWTPPPFVRPKPGQPPVDFVAVQKEAFVKWLAGAGKDYKIKKFVAKTKK